MLCNLRGFFFFIIFFLLSSVVFCKPATNNFISLSDIHFNPFYTCHPDIQPCPIIEKLNAADVTQWQRIFTQYGSKEITHRYKHTNYPLLKSTLEEVKSIAKQQQTKFAIIIGDYLAHDYEQLYQKYSAKFSQKRYKSFVKKTLQFLTLEIRSALPSIPIYCDIGNNDSYHGDYYNDPKGLFYHDLAQSWSSLLLGKENKVNLLSTFPIAGYYSVTPPDSNDNRIILLNSVLFSKNARGNNIKRAANNELNWLKKKLRAAKAKKQHIWLVFHIPLGIDVYHTQQGGHVVTFWQSRYIRRFLAMLSQYTTTITGIFTGHLHMDAFELLNLNGNHEIFDSFTPSISPIFGNNPGFKNFYYYGNNFKVANFTLYYLPLDKQRWQTLYDFNKIYQPACNNCNLIDGMKKLHHNKPESLIKHFKYYYPLASDRANINKELQSWPYYWCAIHNLTPHAYNRCCRRFRKTASFTATQDL